MTANRAQRGRRTKRRGAAAVEFAVVVPLLILFFFSALEFGRMHMVRHTMQNAAYEAARHGLAPNVSDDDIRRAAEIVLRSAAVRNAHVSVSHGNADVTVVISASFSDQGWFSPLYFRNSLVTSSMTLGLSSG